MNKPESSEMVLVPREPTPEMLADGLRAACLYDAMQSRDDLSRAYRAMLKASPQAVPSEQPIAEQPQAEQQDSVYLGSAGPSEDLPPALPYDITVGGNTFRKGVALSTFILAAQHWHRAAFPDGYELTDEQKAENLANLQSCVRDADFDLYCAKVAGGHLASLVDELRAEIAALKGNAANTPAHIPDGLRAEDQGPLHQPDTGKEAARWRWWRHGQIDFCWSPVGRGMVKWIRYVAMPEPDISERGLAKADAVQQLEVFIDAQIAKGAA